MNTISNKLQAKWLEKILYLGYNYLMPKKAQKTKIKMYIAKSTNKIKTKRKLRIPKLILDLRGADKALVESLAAGMEDLHVSIRVLGHGAERLPHVFSTEEALEEGNIWVLVGKTLPREFSMIIQRGIVPIMMEGVHPKAENYIASEEKGNAFVFQKASEWHIYGSIVRALENFSFVYDWSNLKNNIKELM